jgi:hypothetical protein
MALSDMGPHLIFDQDGDALLHDRYTCGSVYCGLERADMDLNRSTFDQLMKGPRFSSLLHHMAVTKSLGMKWNYFEYDVFVDADNVKYHVCSICQHLAPYKCSCGTSFYCSVRCQRGHWVRHKEACASRK